MFNSVLISLEFGNGNSDDGKLGNPGMVDRFDSRSETKCSVGVPPHAPFSCEYQIVWKWRKGVKKVFASYSNIDFIDLFSNI